MFRASRRGTLSTLLTPDGRPVEVPAYGCAVVKTEAKAGGKTYVTLDAGAAATQPLAALDTLDARLRAVDDAVRERVPGGRLDFSPYALYARGGGGRLVTKLLAATAYEDVRGDPAPPWPLLPGAAVDVVLRLGNYGAFGYCWLLARVKPHGLNPEP